MTKLDSETIESVIRLQTRIADAIAAAADERAAINASLEPIAKFAGWPVGHAYLVDSEDSDLLVPSGLWYLEKPRKFAKFRKLTEATTFSPGEGLPGAARAAGRTIWVPDLQASPNFPRAKQGFDIGLTMGFGTPVMVGGRLFAVLEFYAEERAEPEKYLLTLLDEIGRQIGRHVERLAQEAASRRQAEIMQRLSEGVMIVNAEGWIVDCNPALGKLTGYSRDELLTMRTVDLTPAPELWDERRKAIYEAVAKDGFWEGLVDVRRKDGTERKFELSLRPLSTARSSNGHHVTLARDVTERSSADEAIRRQALILEQVKEGIWIGSLDWKIIECNPALEAISGYSREELIGMDGSELSAHPESWRRGRDLISKALERGESWAGQAEYRRKDGSIGTAEVSISPFLDASGQRLANLYVTRDVTERVASERSLRQQALIMEQLQDAVYVTDLAGQIVECNKATETITGYSRDELIGMDAAELNPDADAWRARRPGLFARLDRGEIFRADVPFLRKEGWIGSAEIVVAPFLDEAGKRTANLVLLRDVTEKAELETQLRQAQKMEAVGQLTGGIAHDFNNLLTSVIGNLELAEGSLPEGSPRRRIRAALDASLKSADLTQRLLAFSRKQPLQPAATDLSVVIADMRHLLSSLGEDIEVELDLHDEPVGAHVDRVQLENAVLNLAINSRQAMPAGGRLSIGTTIYQVDQNLATEIGVDADDLVSCVIVRDSGSGMSADVLEHVFEPFFTTKDVGVGSGLGLSMVYGFAKQSGGHVAITSAPGSGTRVTLYFPYRKLDLAKRGEIAEAAQRTYEKSGPSTPLEVLLVEDNPGVRDVAVELLGSLGHHVQVAETGAEALGMIGNGTRFDLLFTDVVLPGGVSGIEVARKFRSDCPEGRVLVTSGYSEAETARRGKASETFPLLRKPYKRKDLLRALSAIFTEQEA